MQAMAIKYHKKSEQNNAKGPFTNYTRSAGLVQQLRPNKGREGIGEISGRRR